MNLQPLLSGSLAHRSPLAACTHAAAHRGFAVRRAEPSGDASQAETLKAETYLGEKFTKTVPNPPGSWERQQHENSSIKIQRLDHCAVEVTDVEKSIKFYTEVLNFEQLARPGFPFGGAWLNAGGLTLHLIEKDPSVDRAVESREAVFSNQPEPWYIRRSEHKAFQVSDLEATEAALKRSGVEYHKFIVPGTSAAQIFLFDPDLNGIELGANYGEIADLLKDKKPS